jgi:serine/tyrosine/threonine adenylyltransferase
VVREYLVSEAMFALGVPTSRALAAVFTGEPVYRDRPQPGGILTRVASSHIRIGTFQYVAMLQNKEALQQLADYVIKRHYPQLQHETEPYLALLRAVCQAQARLVAHWMSIGFIHGVMNTDNMTVSGETIDYGPCAFLDSYDPHTVFSSIDQQGRYAYKNQPAITQWNLARLAEALLPLLHQDEQQAVALATAVLNEFPAMYQQQWQQRFCAKLALSADEKNAALVQQLLDLLAAGQLDFTQTFRRLSETLTDPLATTGPAEYFADTSAYQSWHQSWLQHLQQEHNPLQTAEIQARMNSVNPLFIPRNHQIEQIILDVTTQQDLTLFNQFAADLKSPFHPTPDNARWAEPPIPGGAPYRTFCGT